MNVVGFDFGTTNSLISIVRGNRVINFLDEYQRPFPSVACYEGEQKILGRDAKERLEQAGLGVHGNIIRSPKMYLGRPSIFVAGTEKNPAEIVADVVSHVHQQVRLRRALELGDISGAVVTIPVNMDGCGRRALREAFRLANLRIVQFVHEPLAALYGLFRGQDPAAMLRRYDQKLILVFDWGGGTLDLTLCRPIGNMVVQLLNDGTDEVGGDVFDEAIMNRLVQNVRMSRQLDGSVETYQGAQARLMAGCERAKIDLSTRSNVVISVRDFFRGIADKDFDYQLSQSELERTVMPLIDKGFQRIERILKDADFSMEQVALCVATGGMSNMPTVKRRLHEWFGPERVRIPDGTATLIAEGAAWIANDQVELNLAKSVELVLARNSYLSLVKAGTKMPKEREVQSSNFHLYCTDPRDGVAKFQFCAPKRTGPTVSPSDPRIHLHNLTVNVDGHARAFQERLELDVRINDDLILEAHARSLNMKDEDRCEVHSLEFGLRFPTDSPATDSGGDSTESQDLEAGSQTLGAISVRANVSDRTDASLVPGEFLYEYDPHYFDRRNNPPREQEHELLYYEPCAGCGRASNDPACQC